MVAIARGAALSASNPLLSEYTSVDGKLVAPVSMSWTIYDVSTGAKEDEPLLVAGPTTVNLTTHRVSTGRYAVAWTVPADAVLGRYQISWTAQLVAGGATLTWVREFEVVAAGVRTTTKGYVLAADLRREGVTADQASNADLRRLIEEASDFIDRATGTWFEARASTYKLDGGGRDALFLQVPTVAIESVTLGSYGTTQVVDASAYVVYGGWSSPHDRWMPRIVRVSALQGSPLVPAYAWTGAGYAIAPVWPQLRQNVTVAGLFGYLDDDGSPVGGTPTLIQKACKLLVIRNLAKLADPDGQDARARHRVLSEKTREQSYELDKDARVAAGLGTITSDPEIDALLEMYMRPPYVGFAAA